MGFATDELQPIVTDIRDSLYSGDIGLPKLLQGKDYWVKFLKDEFNQRANVLDFGGDLEKLSFALFEWCRQEKLGKVVLKAQDYEWESLLSLGFSLEGIARYYFEGAHGYFMAKFLDPRRRYSEQLEKEDSIIEAVTFTRGVAESGSGEEFLVTRADLGDVDELAAMYDRVFDTYPTPLNEANYLATLLDTQVILNIIRHQGRIVSAASAWVDAKNRNAEITDCATLPEFRGQGLMNYLIFSLEETMAAKDIQCLYGMARSLSHGMNLLFKKHGYGFQGRLVNQCNIMGQFEDVNLWVKRTGM